MRQSLKGSASGNNNGLKKAGFLAKASFLTFMALSGFNGGEEAQAQTRDVTKDTTEIRTFFKNPKIFSAEEMKEFDMLRNDNLKSPIGEFVMKEIMINFDVKRSDYEATVITCILLDPDRTTSLGKRAYEELKNNSQYQRLYGLILRGIEKEIELKGKEETIKGKEETIKGKEETIKGKEETIKGKEETIKGKEETIKELKTKNAKEEEELRKKEEELRKKEEELRKKEEELRKKREELKALQEFGKKLDDMKKVFEQFDNK